MSGWKNQVKEFRAAGNDFAHTGGRAAATDRHLNALWYFRAMAAPGGLNTKIHMVVDVMGRPAAAMKITPGNTSDTAVAPGLPETSEDTAVVDEGDTTAGNCGILSARDCVPCIPARKNVKNPEAYDVELYRTRHVVKNLASA